VVRTAWTGRELAAGTRSWTWDGKNASGGWVAPGRYTAELVAKSWLGTTRLTRGVLVDAFSASVSDATLKAGQTLTVRFRSVEPLSSRPTVTFSQPGRADVKVKATRLSDGSYRARFTVQSGATGAAKAVVRAKDSGGHINTTTVALAIVS
jgi:hypothetical protein